MKLVVAQSQCVQHIQPSQGLMLENLQLVVAQIQQVEVLLCHKGARRVHSVYLIVSQV